MTSKIHFLPYRKQSIVTRPFSEFLVIQAEVEHIKGAKALADANRDIFAFITRQAFEDAHAQNGLLVAHVEGQIIGFVRYYHRKTDRQTTLYDICVAEEWRSQGVGEQLLVALIVDCTEQAREFILLKCPAHLPANQFYARKGFTLTSTQPGKHHELNVWRLSLTETREQ